MVPIQYDGQIDIATGFSANTKIWKNKPYTWSHLVQKLSAPQVTGETIKQYLEASKEDRSRAKDVGGYVGGRLLNGRRKPAHVVHRQLITLDIDYIKPGCDIWDEFTLFFNSAAVLHSTHSHTENNPRYRLIIPLNRECASDEYAAISRKVADLINIEYFDSTTFQSERLMFWPSISSDVEYVFRLQNGPWLDADFILNLYPDWTDSSYWPVSSIVNSNIRKNIDEKQEDPLNKKGVIGAFCRTYTVSAAISEFLTDQYVLGEAGRYTYTKGSTSNGLVIYDDKYAFSHHGTDPCSGKLCNAWDLVRIHKFKHLDGDGKEDKSAKAMSEFARENKAVKQTLAGENLQNAAYDFSDSVPEHYTNSDQIYTDTLFGNSGTDVFDDELFGVNEWLSDLDIDARGKYLPTANNVNLIFKNDVKLKNKFKLNVFSGKPFVFPGIPWRTLSKPEPLKNVDFSGLRNYIETFYGISGSQRIEDALTVTLERNCFHPVRDYLSGLTWDNVPRIDNLLIDYFGVKDSLYTREAMRKTLVGAVARVYNPGVKFDLVLTLVGEKQGTGKSTFISKLGGEWFSDTFTTVQGKEAFEQIQGAWLIEIAELSGLRKAEIETVKHFISKCEDMFRPAYGRTVENFARQCVFIATTNRVDFLRDPTGNRRFMPVLVRPEKAKYSTLTKRIDSEIGQIWAEAVALYRAGEKLYLTTESERLAKAEQLAHSENDDRSGLITRYLNRSLPNEWPDMGLNERTVYLENTEASKISGFYRDFVCAAEIWCECLGRDRKDMNKYNTREINDILRGLPDWEFINSTKNFKLYGKQKYYQRLLVW